MAFVLEGTAERWEYDESWPSLRHVFLVKQEIYVLVRDASFPRLLASTLPTAQSANRLLLWQ